MSHEKQTSLLFYKLNEINSQTRAVDIVCYILVVLGLVGNIFGLFIFSSSRRTWRVSPIYVYLATSNSITNVFCVLRYAFLLHSKLRNFLYEVVGEQWWACKLYEFSFSFRLISSWITLFWMLERLLCVSKRLRHLFNRCHLFKLKFILP